jgi:hypothetical protein
MYETRDVRTDLRPDSTGGERKKKYMSNILMLNCSNNILTNTNFIKLTDGLKFYII